MKTLKLKPKSSKSNVAHAGVKHWRWWAVTGVVVLLAAGQLAFDIRTALVLKQVSNNSVIAGLIVDAANNLQRPAVIEPVSRKVYVPEARLVLPFYPTYVRGISFSYSEPFDGSDEAVSLTTVNATQVAASKLRSEASQSAVTAKDLERTFDLVPQLQACSRGMTITLSRGALKDASMAKDGQERLADGRTAYFYFENCALQPAKIADYFKQVESY